MLVWRTGSGRLLAWLRGLTAVDLRIDTEIVEGPSQDGHDRRSRFSAVLGAAAEVVPLAGGDSSNGEPDNQHNHGDAGADTAVRRSWAIRGALRVRGTSGQHARLIPSQSNFLRTAQGRVPRNS